MKEWTEVVKTIISISNTKHNNLTISSILQNPIFLMKILFTQKSLCQRAINSTAAATPMIQSHSFLETITTIRTQHTKTNKQIGRNLMCKSIRASILSQISFREMLSHSLQITKTGKLTKDDQLLFRLRLQNLYLINIRVSPTTPQTCSKMLTNGCLKITWAAKVRHLIHKVQQITRHTSIQLSEEGNLTFTLGLWLFSTLII